LQTLGYWRRLRSLAPPSYKAWHYYRPPFTGPYGPFQETVKVCDLLA
jgi:hypothetical protein